MNSNENLKDSYQVEIDGEIFVVTFLDAEGTVQLGDETGQLIMRPQEVPNHYSMLVNSESYLLGIEDDEDINKFRVHVGGYDFDAEVVSSREAFLREYLRAAGVGKKEGNVKSPMPGLIIKLDAKAGDTVSVGQNILIMEAMKMENQIKSPIDGTLKEVLVEEGDAVNKGQLLFVIE